MLPLESLIYSLWLQIRHFHKNDVRNGCNPIFTTHQQLTIPSNTIMIIWRRMLHHPTILNLIDLKNNHSLMRMVNYGCFSFWDMSNSVVFQGFWWKSMSPSDLASNFIWISVLISNFPNFDYGRSLYEPLNFFEVFSKGMNTMHY